MYINTTFPVQPGCSAEEMIDFTHRNADKITCINVSRHLQRYVEESPDEVVAAIATPKRINCVLYKNYPADKLTEYVERWRKYNIPIQFRYDYTETTPENLYEEEHDKILQDLKKQFTYKGLDGCRMRNGFHFEYKGLHMTYHKTLPYSTIVETGEDGVTYDILYDILIKQNGGIHFRLDRREDGRGEIPRHPFGGPAMTCGCWRRRGLLRKNVRLSRTFFEHQSGLPAHNLFAGGKQIPTTELKYFFARYTPPAKNGLPVAACGRQTLRTFLTSCSQRNVPKLRPVCCSDVL